MGGSHLRCAVLVDYIDSLAALANRVVRLKQAISATSEAQPGQLRQVADHLERALSEIQEAREVENQRYREIHLLTESKGGGTLTVDQACKTDGGKQ